VIDNPYFALKTPTVSDVNQWDKKNAQLPALYHIHNHEHEAVATEAREKPGLVVHPICVRGDVLLHILPALCASTIFLLLLTTLTALSLLTQWEALQEVLHPLLRPSIGLFTREIVVPWCNTVVHPLLGRPGDCCAIQGLLPLPLRKSGEGVVPIERAHEGDVQRRLPLHLVHARGAGVLQAPVRCITPERRLNPFLHSRKNREVHIERN
jgi:hypothetical protein